MYLWREFSSIRKGVASMPDYIANANHLLDTLAMAGEPLSQSDIVLTVLGGLGVEYEPFVTSITTRYDSAMTFIDLQALLLDQVLLRLAASRSSNQFVEEDFSLFGELRRASHFSLSTPPVVSGIPVISSNP